MSWLDLSGKIDAFKRELDGIDEAIGHAMRNRTALQACTACCFCMLAGLLRCCSQSPLHEEL
jgi:hypothetical protein